MSEVVLVKEEVKSEKICDCGAEVRSESEYCYNCGGRVQKVTEAVGKDTGVRTFEAANSGRTAAKTRTRRIRPEQQTVEVVWRRSDGPGYLVLFIALGIAAIVAVFIAVAFYLR